MYKLTVVAGPENRGKSYSVRDGDNLIGRNENNQIVLQSTQVSKRHCVLVVSNGELVVRDQGSANGTFVNGMLTRSRNVRVGDRISVGDYVLEISERSTRPATSSSGGGSVIPFPVVGASPGMPGHAGQIGMPGGFSQPGAAGMHGQPAADMNADMANTMPKDLAGKALWHFERFVMPVFYGLNQRNQWKWICVGLMAAFAVANLFVSVQPLLLAGRAAVVHEAGRRATYMARQIAERNAPFLAARAETKTEIGAAENAEGVRVAVLADLDGRIIAPASKMNQYLTTGGEALIANKARDLFRTGRETGVISEPDPSTIVAVEPVKVMSTVAGKNIVIAMAVISIDTTLTTLGTGDDGLVYSETMILTMLIGGLVLLILYRMTLKPLQVLGDDIDKALKGELTQVTHEFKLEELDPLWDLVNSALQRLPRGAAAGKATQSDVFSVDEYVAPFRALAEMQKTALVICDGERKVQYLSPAFEDASGIRAEGAMGQEISQLGRDSAFASLMTDLIDRSATSASGVADNYDFSGITHQVQVTAFTGGGTQPKAYVVVATKGGE